MAQPLEGELILAEPELQFETWEDQCRFHIDEIRKGYGHALEHAIALGDSLNSKKQQCEHGEWLPWLERELEITARQATKYMRIAEHRNRLESNQKLTSDLGIEEADKLIRAELKGETEKPVASVPERLSKVRTHVINASKEWPKAHLDELSQLLSSLSKEVLRYGKRSS